MIDKSRFSRKLRKYTQCQTRYVGGCKQCWRKLVLLNDNSVCKVADVALFESLS